MKRHLRTVIYTAFLLVLTILLATSYRPASLDKGKDRRAVTVEAMERTLATLRESVARDPDTVIVIGDSSLLTHFLLKPEQTLGSLLEANAAASGLRIRVLAHRGFGPVAYYLLADQLAELHPRAVVLGANLQAFANEWFRNLKIKHPELTAFISPARTLEAIALPLELAGITDSSLVVGPILRQVGAYGPVMTLREYRRHFREWLDTASTQTKAAIASQRGAIKGRLWAAKAGRWKRRRGRRKKARGWVTNQFQSFIFYPNRLTRDHPATQLMAATVRRLTASGCPTVVLILPVHVQALRMTGEYKRRDIDGAIRLISRITEENGGILLDLSHLLTVERYFQDSHTHFTWEGNKLVSRRALEELGRILVTEGSVQKRPHGSSK